MVSRWWRAIEARHGDVMRDVAAGMALAVALSLILRRDLFGLAPSEVLTLYYGRF